MKFWIVIYEHRFGTDVWPIWEYLSATEVIEALDDFEEERGESIEITGPFYVPQEECP